MHELPLQQPPEQTVESQTQPPVVQCRPLQALPPLQVQLPLEQVLVVMGQLPHAAPDTPHCEVVSEP